MEALAWFALGSLSFWILVLAEIGLFFYCCEKNLFYPGLIGTIVFLLVTWLIGGLPVWDYIAHKPYTVLGWAAGFVGIGVMWSLFKWDRRTSGLAKKVKQDPKNTIETGEKYGGGYSAGYIHEMDFRASHNKERICVWMLYWPTSVIWTFFREIIIKGIDNLFELLKSTYERVSQRNYKKVENLFKEAKLAENKERD